MIPLLADRRLILFCGSESWGKKTAHQLIENSALHAAQLYWHQAEENALNILGQDRVMVVINAYQGLDPDVIGRASGTIIAGGALAIICPQLEDWQYHRDPHLKKLMPYPLDPGDKKSHYLHRWSKILAVLEGVEIYTQHDNKTIGPVIGETPDTIPDKACTNDQTGALEAIVKSITGQRRRPAIITADRGRGKSATMGLAAAQLIIRGQAQHIVITSSGFNKTRNLFKHAHAALPDSDLDLTQKYLQHTEGDIRYLPADYLLSKNTDDTHDCDLLLVDEAASLSVSILEELLIRFPRIAFASTEHGYEGSGRGFSLKFKQLIEKHCRGARFFQLERPIRWADQDPLERWVEQLLLLNSKATSTDISKFNSVADLSFESVSQASLVKDEVLLQRVFQLLSDAHYQTRPVDLRHLLDAPNSHLWLARMNKYIIGLVWLMHEGELDKQISLDIAAGKRRPQGHLVPQIITAHLGLVDAARLRCARIQRIVVEPNLQNKGVGSWMLTQLKQHVTGKADYLASSFGADQALTRFWHRAQYNTIRISEKSNAASGLHSTVVMHPLSDSASALQREAQSIFARQFIAQLRSSLCELTPALASEIAVNQCIEDQLYASELETAVLFAYAKRPYESSLAVVHKLAQFTLFSPEMKDALSSKMRKLLILRSLQNQNWQQCAGQLGLSGKAECVQLLRQGVQIILSENYSSDTISDLKEKYGLSA